MSRLILLRHGQSEWNKKNLFTGWVDIPLSQEGIDEATQAGLTLQETPIDVIFTSSLIRGLMTAMIVMSLHKSGKVPVVQHPKGGKLEEWGTCNNPETLSQLIPTIQAWELNERMYGELQGMNKEQMREKYGEAQVQLWRRSYDVAPPNGESLKMTAERVLPFFYRKIVPFLEEGNNVLVSAHGNSLRSIVMDLDKLSSTEITHLEIPTGKPFFYEYTEGGFRKSL